MPTLMNPLLWARQGSKDSFPFRLGHLGMHRIAGIKDQARSLLLIGDKFGNDDIEVLSSGAILRMHPHHLIEVTLNRFTQRPQIF